MQPYSLMRDERDATVYRVAADAQSKIAVDGVVLLVDETWLERIGADPTIIDVPSTVGLWLDSIPTL